MRIKGSCGHLPQRCAGERGLAGEVAIRAVQRHEVAGLIDAVGADGALWEPPASALGVGLARRACFQCESCRAVDFNYASLGRQRHHCTMGATPNNDVTAEPLPLCPTTAWDERRHCLPQGSPYVFAAQPGARGGDLVAGRGIRLGISGFI